MTTTTTSDVGYGRDGSKKTCRRRRRSACRRRSSNAAVVLASRSRSNSAAVQFFQIIFKIIPMYSRSFSTFPILNSVGTAIGPSTCLLLACRAVGAVSVHVRRRRRDRRCRAFFSVVVGGVLLATATAVDYLHLAHLALPVIQVRFKSVVGTSGSKDCKPCNIADN